jgi:hypothetical protein
VMEQQKSIWHVSLMMLPLQQSTRRCEREWIMK